MIGLKKISEINIKTHTEITIENKNSIYIYRSIRLAFGYACEVLQRILRTATLKQNNNDH